ncbi:MAG: iron ABC transporter permease, partial [Acetivibrio sp.]
WQLGSFSMKEWSYVVVLFPIVIGCILFFMRYANEMDIMTFGEEQALSMGIDLKKTKWILIGLTAALTGTAVAFVGIIGFVDLIAPHVVRRFFGSSHKFVIPMSALFGGSFMVLVDILARTLVSPSEIPIGSITALVGAPFFIYLFFQSRREK